MCFDSNRIGFDNHNVKDSSGNITCTYLINIKCYSCGNFGHTPKYCKANKNIKFNKSTTYYKSPPLSSSPSLSLVNTFAILSNELTNSDNLIDTDELPPVSDIIWGVGFKSTLNNKSWANICCEVSA
tara:strand:+ start:1032 stop:1412 length:381 start_codon:yes stop_codon:yes gene_type:complete